VRTPIGPTKEPDVSTTREELAPLEDLHVPIRVKLAAAWTSLMFLYVYVDLLGLYEPGVVDDILAGIVWQFDISQAWAFGALTLMAVPILMVVLSVTLPARGNRVINLVVASVYVLVSVGNAIGESWTYFFGLAVALEVTVLALVVRWAWTWPRRTSPEPGAPREVVRQQHA
jgi:hypothetical protein